MGIVRPSGGDSDARHLSKFSDRTSPGICKDQHRRTALPTVTLAKPWVVVHETGAMKGKGQVVDRLTDMRSGWALPKAATTAGQT